MEGDDDNTNLMMDEIVSNGTEDVTNRSRRVISSGEQLDVEAYAALYTGRTKIVRLMFIADQCAETNPSMQLEALRMAYDEIKKGENTQLYREIVLKINGRLGLGYELDSDWADAIDRRAEQRKDKLENELNAYRVCLLPFPLVFFL